MKSIIAQLRDDHEMMNTIVHYFNDKLKSLQGLTGDKKCTQSFLALLAQLQFYIEHWHRPVEDIIYEVLIHRDIPDAQLLANTMEEHGVLESLLSQLFQYLDHEGLETEVSTARFVEGSRDFIDLQLRHMKLEDRSLYPLAENTLQQADWAEIKDRLEAASDPLKEPRLQEFVSFYLSLPVPRQ